MMAETIKTAVLVDRDFLESLYILLEDIGRELDEWSCLQGAIAEILKELDEILDTD